MLCYGTDIWSLGMVILYILFGHNPYQLSEAEQSKYSHTKLMYTNYYYYTKLSL